MFLAAPSWANRGSVRVRGNTGAGTTGGVQPIHLAVPVLQPAASVQVGGPTLRADGRTLAVAPGVTLTSGRDLASADAAREFPAPLVASALIAPADAARPSVTTALDGVDAAATLTGDAAPAAAAADGAQVAALDGGAHAGSIRFDGAGARAAQDGGGWFAALKRALPFGRDIVPTWPGRAGETVRLGGRSFVLDKIIGEGGGSTVWGVPFGRDYAIKILHPEMATLPHYGDESSILRAISNNPHIPHARLVAASADGRVIVKERFDGDTAAALVAKGGFQRWQLDAWAGLAESLIRAGATADLVASNLQYAHHHSKWLLLDAGGVRDGTPREVLSQLLEPGLTKAAGIDSSAVLGALRGRLGPDSALWAKTAADIRAVPFLAAALAGLDAADAARPAAPTLRFGRAPLFGDGPLNDSLVTRAEAVKRLGFDPWKSKHRSRFIHDKNKLNTELYAVNEPGKPALFMKKADWWMIQKELAVRRLVTHLFGTWFDVPHAIAIRDGADSWLIMDKADGTPAWGKNGMTLEQRLALGVLANVMGFYDLNTGNILYRRVRGKSGRPTLLDFEQAFGRRGPVPGRLPDEGLLLEMPWVDGWQINHASDYNHAARDWRAKFAEPATVALIRADLLAAGYTAVEADGLILTMTANTSQLDATFQSDVEFANKFAAQRATP